VSQDRVPQHAPKFKFGPYHRLAGGFEVTVDRHRERWRRSRNRIRDRVPSSKVIDLHEVHARRRDRRRCGVHVQAHSPEPCSIPGVLEHVWKFTVSEGDVPETAVTLMTITPEA
jgi:hypothetical protein